MENQIQMTKKKERKNTMKDKTSVNYVEVEENKVLDRMIWLSKWNELLKKKKNGGRK